MSTIIFIKEHPYGVSRRSLQSHFQKLHSENPTEYQWMGKTDKNIKFTASEAFSYFTKSEKHLKENNIKLKFEKRKKDKRKIAYLYFVETKNKELKQGKAVAANKNIIKDVVIMPDGAKMSAETYFKYARPLK